MVGRVEIDHAHLRPRHRMLERPDIQVAHLVGRKHDHAPRPRNHARHVARDIVMRRDARGVAQPQPRLCGGGQDRHRVGGSEPPCRFVGQHRPRIDMPRRRARGRRKQRVQYLRQAALRAVEVEAVHARAVEIIAALPRFAMHHAHRLPGIERPQIRAERHRTLCGQRYDRPVRDQPAHHHGFPGRRDLLLEHRAGNAFAHGDGLANVDHRQWMVGWATLAIRTLDRVKPTPLRANKANGSRTRFMSIESFAKHRSGTEIVVQLPTGTARNVPSIATSEVSSEASCIMPIAA